MYNMIVSDAEFFIFAKTMAQVCALVVIPLIGLKILSVVFNLGVKSGGTTPAERDLYSLWNGGTIRDAGRQARERETARAVRNIETMEVDKWTKSFREKKW